MKKKIIINFIAIAIIILLSIPTYAANSTTNTAVSNTSTKSTSNGSKQSNNANLSNLGISPNDFSGFKESKTEYSVTVQNKTTEIEVYATPKDNKAKVTGTGKVKLNEGENAVKITVTAEDGTTTKTYTINVKRLKSGEKDAGTKNSLVAELKKLEVTGAKLNPEFNKDTHQYTIEYDGNEKKLDIIAEATEANSKVEIIGNDQLINGQNIVTIIVTDAKETSANTYQIYVNKNLVSQEELNKQIEEANLQYNIKLWIARVLIALITICIIALLIILYKRQKSEEYQNAKKEKKQNKKEKQKEKNKSKREKIKEKNRSKKEKNKKEDDEEQDEHEKNSKHKRKH